MDSVQINPNFAVVLLLGIGTLAAYVVFDAGTVILFMGCVLLIGGGLGQLADHQNASHHVRTAINSMSVIGLGVALLWLPVVGDTVAPTILAGTLIVLGLLMPTDYFSGPVAWGGMAVGFTIAAVAEVLNTGVLIAALYGGIAVVFVGQTIRSLRRSTHRSSPQ